MLLKQVFSFYIYLEQYTICEEVFNVFIKECDNLQYDIKVNRTLLSLAEKISTELLRKNETIYLVVKLLETYQGCKKDELLQIKEQSIKLIINTLKNPNYTKLSSYLSLDSIKCLKDEKDSETLYNLFKLFVTSSYSEIFNFYNENKSKLQEYNLSSDDIFQHSRLLTLCSLASESDILSYETIAKELDISIDDVENWVVLCISQKLIECKMNQVKNEVVILRSCTRTFDNAKWSKLEEKLIDFTSKLNELLEVLDENPIHE